MPQPVPNASARSRTSGIAITGPTSPATNVHLLRKNNPTMGTTIDHATATRIASQAASIPRRRGLVVLEEAFGSLVQMGELFLDDRPDHVEVDSKVLVCDQIAESDDLPPRDLGSKGPSVVGDLCRRLADDDEVVENCIAGLSVE